MSGRTRLRRALEGRAGHDRRAHAREGTAPGGHGRAVFDRRSRLTLRAFGSLDRGARQPLELRRAKPERGKSWRPADTITRLGRWKRPESLSGPLAPPLLPTSAGSRDDFKGDVKCRGEAG